MPTRSPQWGERPRGPLPAIRQDVSTEVSSHHSIYLPACDYNLDATLDSGQVFRWQKQGGSWYGVLGNHFLQLSRTDSGIHAIADTPVSDWTFLREFLQADLDLVAVLKTFPDDAPMQAAVASCSGLRLLRQ